MTHVVSEGLTEEVTVVLRPGKEKAASGKTGQKEIQIWEPQIWKCLVVLEEFIIRV